MPSPTRLLVFAAAVAAAALESARSAATTLTGAVLLILLCVITAEQAYRRLRPEILLLIIGMVVLGMELAAELCVIMVLFGTGLRIDRLATRKRWEPTLRLLLIGMPLTIAGAALFGFSWAGMSLAGAIQLSAVLAPTDPVLAGDV